MFQRDEPMDVCHVEEVRERSASPVHPCTKFVVDAVGPGLESVGQVRMVRSEGVEVDTERDYVDVIEHRSERGRRRGRFGGGVPTRRHDEHVRRFERTVQTGHGDLDESEAGRGREGARGEGLRQCGDDDGRNGDTVYVCRSVYNSRTIR